MVLNIREISLPENFGCSWASNSDANSSVSRLRFYPFFVNCKFDEDLIKSEGAIILTAFTRHSRATNSEKWSDLPGT